MFEAEQKQVEKLILSYCAEQGLPAPQEITWSPVPFSGEWGIATTFFQVAAQEARLGRGGGKPVAVRAQEIAAEAAASLGRPAGFFRVEAVKGYLNLYFAPAEFTRRVIDEALEAGPLWGGRCPRRAGDGGVFQPNTHKAFHVGHLRSAILGEAVCPHPGICRL